MAFFTMKNSAKTNTMKGKLTLFLCLWTFMFSLQSSYGKTTFNNTTLVNTSSSFYVSNLESILTDTLVSLADTTYYQVSNCTDAASVCMDIPLSEINNFQIFQNGQAYAGGIMACNIDTLIAYDYSTLDGQGSTGPYTLQSWIVNGVIQTANFNTIAELVDSMNVWDPTGNWVDSTGLNQIIGGDDANTYSESIVVWVPATSSPNIINQRDYVVINGTSISLPVGDHQIIINETATACSDTFNTIIRCIQAQVFNFSILEGEMDQACLDFSSLTTAPDTVHNYCPVMMDPDVAFNFIRNDSCLTFSGLQVGIDTACVRFCDENQLCDTSTFIVEVRGVTGFTEQNIGLSLQMRDTICLDTTVFAGTVDTIYNYCPGNSGTYASFELDTLNYCVYIEGLAARGTDTACIVICDFPTCDTLQLNVEVVRVGPLFVYDTLFVNQNSQFCDFDTSNLAASLLLLDNFCPGTSGEFVDFTINNTSLCAEYNAIDVGTDTACILMRDLLGNPDTTYLIVTGILPVPQILFDTIRPGLTASYCNDTTELGGTVRDTIFLCQSFNGNASSLNVIDSTLCAEVTGQNAGTDTLCMAVCDDMGICDTTTIYVTVDTSGASSLLPIAFSDVDSTSRNSPVTINALANDTIPNNFWTQFFVIPVASGGIGPNNGSTIGNAADGTIQYIPNRDFCGDFDVFSYAVCTAAGCDTANVTVFVNCPSDTLRVMNGFSPNGDGKNDSFMIAGIENYPNHTLYIYNRWGNLVFERQNYRNDWTGTWDGTDLPDGVYFYLLDTGEDESLSGYVLIHR